MCKHWRRVCLPYCYKQICITHVNHIEIQNVLPHPCTANRHPKSFYQSFPLNRISSASNNKIAPSCSRSSSCFASGSSRTPQRKKFLCLVSSSLSFSLRSCATLHPMSPCFPSRGRRQRASSFRLAIEGGSLHAAALE